MRNLEELNLTCDRLEAAQTCRNLVGTLSYFDSAFRTNDFIALWADTENAALELDASANYIWQEYALDFLHTDAGWRIQSLKVRTFFDTPFDTPWSESVNTMWGREQIIAEM